MPAKKVVLTRPTRSGRETYVREKLAGGREDGPPSPSIRGEEGARSPRSCAPGTQLQQALDLVEALPANELKKLYDAIALRLATDESGRDRDLSMWITAVYDALLAANGTGGAGMAGPLALKRVLGARASWTPVSEFVRSTGLGDATVAQRLSVYRMLATLLVKRCEIIAKHARIPLTPKLVANNTENIAAIFNGAFPGYVEAGLMPLLLKRLVSGEIQRPEDE